MAISKEEIADWFQDLQSSIILAVERQDGGGQFILDEWERPGGGGGKTRVIENAQVIEKGGVNFSAVHGSLPERISSALGVGTSDFYATGVSIVMHPRNPFVPIIHMNVRYFELSSGLWWFGGGIDLTPHYVNEDEAKWFHNQMKDACDKTDPEYHERFAKWADKYFYIKHRKESRGVSGIFFDRLNTESEGKSKDEIFSFVQNVGSAFAPVYTKLMADNRDKPYTNEHKRFQFLRRSRYAEFNLVYDKGTKFGLDTDGRIESILMSLPPETGWHYDSTWPEGSDEERTLKYLQSVHVPN